MKQSETIAKLAEALAKAQGEMQNAAKDKNNPFFKSTYADLASVWGACREPLSRNGLSVSQFIDTISDKIILTTVLMHMSGEWMSCEVNVVPVKNDPQGIGSATTYFRRYSLSAIVGIAPAEDDGEAAMGRGKPQEQRAVPIYATPIVPKPKVLIDAPKPISDPHRIAALKWIQTLQKKLEISDDQLKAEIHKEFGVNSAKLLNLDQLGQFGTILQAAYDAGLVPAQPSQVPENVEPSFADFQ